MPYARSARPPLLNSLLGLGASRLAWARTQVAKKGGERRVGTNRYSSRSGASPRDSNRGMGRRFHGWDFPDSRIFLWWCLKFLWQSFFFPNCREFLFVHVLQIQCDLIPFHFQVRLASSHSGCSRRFQSFWRLRNFQDLFPPPREWLPPTSRHFYPL